MENGIRKGKFDCWNWGKTMKWLDTIEKYFKFKYHFEWILNWFVWIKEISMMVKLKIYGKKRKWNSQIFSVKSVSKKWFFRKEKLEGMSRFLLRLWGKVDF